MDRNELKAIIVSLQPAASRGHYLDRLIAVSAGVLGSDSPYTDLLQANRRFLVLHFKPAGLQELCIEVAEFVLSKCIEHGLFEADIAPIAWGLSLTALENYNLEGARK